MTFPHFTVLRASAGSGKTYALARRFALFLLSDSIPRNRPANLLAITFSNNAAREMRERILLLLKQLHLGDREVLADFGRDLAFPEAVLERRAGEVIEDLLSHYSDFQIKTIDSFMTTVFKASAIDFGYNPDFEILMGNEPLMAYAFELFLRRVREGTEEAGLMGEVVDIIAENRAGEAPFPFEPTGDILREIEEIYRKVAACGKPVAVIDEAAAAEALKAEMGACLEGLDTLIEGSDLERNMLSSYWGMLASARARRFTDLMDRGMKRNPVKRPKGKIGLDAYLRIVSEWDRLAGLVTDFTRLFACTYYTPYLRTFEAFSALLERAKKHEGKIFIEDVNKRLAEYLDGEVVPDVYLRLGEAIFHYLIDEFQDTSPVQWRNLLPLIENSLSQGGSLFVVGDTKQAVYGFRDADYRIMKGVEEENPFPSAGKTDSELHTNYRSDGAVVAFSERLFKTVLPGMEGYGSAGRESGLLDYRQCAREGRERKGFVETCILQRDDREPPERERLCALLDGLIERGYRRSDVTVLTPRNSDVVKVTTWLNANGVPFVSYSSLDIRRRKVTGEVVALLTFLDSPLDDLAFATFVLGDIMAAALEKQGAAVDGPALHDMCFGGRRRSGPLYKHFQDGMGALWERYFDRLFRLSGYLPLYDLVVEAYRVFDVFGLFPGEEAALSRILEVVKDIEAKGGALRSFLQCAASEGTDEADWNTGIPGGIDAVKVMTVHKAKGLGFPVVILLLYGERNRGFRYIVQEQEGSIALLRLRKGVLHADPAFERRYAEEETKERVSRLNRLYVAFTRARSELYVIGVRGQRDSFPFTLLSDEEGRPCGEPAIPEAQGLPDEGESIGTFHHGPAFEAPLAPDGPINYGERKRGEVVHRLLSLVDYMDGQERLAAAAETVRRAEGPEALADDLEERLARFLAGGPIAPYFERRPGRIVFLEKELADGEGRLFRVDRLVVDPDTVTVIEYKTGGDEGEEAHAAQMRNYLRLAAGIYEGKRVEGVIAYIDGGKTRKIGP